MSKRNRNNKQDNTDFAEFRIKDDGTAEATINCTDDDVCKQFEEYISKFTEESGIEVKVSRKKAEPEKAKRKINKKMIFGIAGGVLAVTAGAIILKQVFGGDKEDIPQPAAETVQPVVDEIKSQLVDDLGMRDAAAFTSAVVDTVRETRETF